MSDNRARPKPTNSEKITPSVRRAKRTEIATWIGVVIAALAIVFGLYQFYVSGQPKPVVDSLTVSGVELLLSDPAPIQDIHLLSGDASGIIPVHWRFILANLGEKDLSVVKYSVFDQSDEVRLGTYYTGIDQGLYPCDGKDGTSSLPISVSNGGSVSICLGIGFIMDKQAFESVTSHFPNKPASFGEIESWLRSNGTDIYGNQLTVTSFDGKNTYQYPPMERIKEQLFIVNFITSRGQTVHRLLAYHICNGVMEFQIPFSCLLGGDLKTFITPQP